MLENKKILILGLARSGYHVAKLLTANNNSNEIIVTDKNLPAFSILDELRELGITFKQSETAEEIIDETFDLIIKNPGIEPTQPCVVKATNLNIPIVNEMEVAYHYLPEDVKIIGITGSNGKTTTTTMIYDLMKLIIYQ